MRTHHFPKRASAAVMAAVLAGTGTGCGRIMDEFLATEPSVSTTTVAETETTVVPDATDAPTTEAETEPPTTEHISPTEQIVSRLGWQLDTSATLDRDAAEDDGKLYKAPLSYFMEDGDTGSRFTFIFYAADGASDIGTFKGGCGISVSEDCPAATDEGWYQSNDFEVRAQGSYCEVTWDVPEDVRPYVTASGEVQVGYWWGSVRQVTLKNVIADITSTRELPVDGTETVTVGTTIYDADDDTNQVRVPLKDVLPEGGVLQAVTYQIHGAGPFHKFTGAFGVTTNDWYQTDTVAIVTDSSDLTLTWLVPDGIKVDIPQDAEIGLGYWWGETDACTLENVTVKYSIGGAPAAAPTAHDNANKPTEPKTDLPSAVVTGSGQAAEIAASIKVGWNLGNTLDSYNKDDKSRDYETSWGNVRTTKAMIDTVKAAGFNAVRIPVSWTNHMDASGNVDAAWLDRVEEVVGYAMDDGMYVILNVHHDDYTWLDPTYAKEADVSAKYTHLWEQIASRFKDYDTHLLFEGLNEPRVVGTSAEWTGGTAEERDVINHLLDKFVTTVRASGGKNAERTLIVTTHAASITDAALDGLALPDDDNLIVSIHNYAPWKFTTAEYPNNTRFDDAGQRELDAQFDKLKAKFIDKGVPVIIGEFGAENKDNPADRTAYYAYYLKAAAARGIPCFIWDNGPSDSYGLLDRANGTWYYPGIMDAIRGAVG